MKKIDGFNEVAEVGAKRNLIPGAYISKILAVVDNPAKEYLEIHFDIISGDFKGFFTDIEKATGKFYGRAFRSYTDKALPYFKGFITAVEKSNKGFTWDWNEQSLVGKNLVIVFGQEEYDDGVSNEVKVNVKPQEFRSLEALEKGDIKIPALKQLDETKRAQVLARATAKPSTSANLKRIEIDDKDLPF
jgi:hypothetical protein